MRNYDYKEQIQRRKELQKMDFISGVQAGRLIRHFLNTFEPDITVNRFRKRCQENVLSFLRNRINIKAEVK